MAQVVEHLPRIHEALSSVPTHNPDTPDLVAQAGKLSTSEIEAEGSVQVILSYIEFLAVLGLEGSRE